MPPNKAHCVYKFRYPRNTTKKGVWIRFKEVLGYWCATLRGARVNIVFNLDGDGHTIEVASRIRKKEVIQSKVGMVHPKYTYDRNGIITIRMYEMCGVSLPMQKPAGLLLLPHHKVCQWLQSIRGRNIAVTSHRLVGMQRAKCSRNMGV